MAVIARDGGDLCDSLHLRHDVYFREGLGRDQPGALDHDVFDPQCDHLLVRERLSGRLCGSFRLNLGGDAGYYSQTKFRLDDFLALPGQKLEIGRACVAREDRNGGVFMMLMLGVLHYAERVGARYIFGCSSVSFAVGEARIAHFCDWLGRRHPLPEGLLLPPLALLELSAAEVDPAVAEDAWRFIRRRTHSPLPFYLSAGAMAGKTPYRDQTLRTYEFFTLLDVQDMTPVGKRLRRDAIRLGENGGENES